MKIEKTIYDVLDREDVSDEEYSKNESLKKSPSSSINSNHGLKKSPKPQKASNTIRLTATSSSTTTASQGAKKPDIDLESAIESV